MSPEDKTLVKTTWAMVVPIADVAATLFYDRLFTLDASLQRLFGNTDMAEQRRKLMQALAADPYARSARQKARSIRRHRSALRHRRRCLAVDARAGPEGRLDAVCQIRMDHRLWHGRGRDAQRCCVELTSPRLTRAQREPSWPKQHI